MNSEQLQKKSTGTWRGTRLFALSQIPLAARVFRTLMAIMAAFDLEARHYDVVNAFTNSTLDETVYCHCPEGYKVENSSLRLLKALYGLR